MSITFRNSTGKKVKLNTPFRNKLENVYGQKLQTNQILRIKNELICSGYVQSEDEVTTELLKDYKAFKTRFPRIEFCKVYLEKSKEIVANLPETVSAKKAFEILKSICPNLPDVTVYYWFERANNKFSTFKTYTKDTLVLVYYMALRKIDRQGTEPVK